jgi:archaemetzincin
MIHVAPLHNPLPGAVDRIQKWLREVFDTPVATHKSRMDLEMALDPTRGQYNSTMLLAELLKELPARDDKIIAITAVDLFVPVLTFVFGEAQLNGNVAIVSTYRLHNSFYGLPDDLKLVGERLEKEVTHELGHVYNLTHCDNYMCVMHVSTSVEEVDVKGARFCHACQEILRNETADSDSNRHLGD